MTEPVTITVCGPGLVPWPEGSVRAFLPKGSRRPVVVHDNPAALKAWRGAVEAKARAARSSFLRRPVAVEMDLYLPRPRGHYRTGRYAHLLRDDAPPYPVSKFDTDKLARAVLDALTGVLYDDDGQVVRLSAAKHWADPTPGAHITIREIWETE